jgi:hypothetical protein
MEMVKNADDIYHEKQILGRCALHCVNNIFQEKLLTYDMMIDITNELYIDDRNIGVFSIFNPYKSIIPYVGYFDINVIMKALSIKKYSISDHIVNVIDLNNYNFDCEDIIGIIINNNDKYLKLISTNHWFGIIKYNNEYYNVDSKINYPFKFININVDLLSFLRISIKKQSQIFVIK